MAVATDCTKQDLNMKKYTAAILLLVSLAVDSSKNPVLELIASTSWKPAMQEMKYKSIPEVRMEQAF